MGQGFVHTKALVSEDAFINVANTVYIAICFSYLFVSHFKQFEGGLLEVGGRGADAVHCLCVLLGQNVLDLADVLFQFITLQH